jgi:hypothetical protein
MVLQKVLMELGPAREFRKELEYLYARRAALDTLIRSLQEYERYLPKPQLVRKRRSA